MHTLIHMLGWWALGLFSGLFAVLLLQIILWTIEIAKEKNNHKSKR